MLHACEGQGQAFYIKGGTPHGFRKLGSTPGAAMEI